MSFDLISNDGSFPRNFVVVVQSMVSIVVDDRQANSYRTDHRATRNLIRTIRNYPVEYRIYSELSLVC
jgi:hypothetical protein